jgi:translation initiation factor 2 alpha subunit (eIF-2alpha)
MKSSVNKVVPKAQLLQTAIEWAFKITQNSPDAVQSTKRALIEATKHGDVEQATLAHIQSPESTRVYQGKNIKVSRVVQFRKCAMTSRVVTLTGGTQSLSGTRTIASSL